jgi:hypothetical protein
MADQSETQSDSAAPERGAYEMMDMDLNQKVRLPFLSIVFMTVGNVRNRLGRSIVTLFGVVLGTAFLMAVGSSGYIRGELTQQEANRTLRGRTTRKSSKPEGCFTRICSRVEPLRSLPSPLPQPLSRPKRRSKRTSAS